MVPAGLLMLGPLPTKDQIPIARRIVYEALKVRMICLPEEFGLAAEAVDCYGFISGFAHETCDPRLRGKFLLYRLHVIDIGN